MQSVSAVSQFGLRRLHPGCAASLHLPLVNSAPSHIIEAQSALGGAPSVWIRASSYLSSSRRWLACPDSFLVPFILSYSRSESALKLELAAAWLRGVRLKKKKKKRGGKKNNVPNSRAWPCFFFSIKANMWLH